MHNAEIPIPIPIPAPDCALFLDIDGTLIDIAATPDAVAVPDGLPQLLRALCLRFGGALGAISGRPLADIDRLLGPGLPAAAEHGAVLRDAAGVVCDRVEPPPSLASVVAALRAATAGLAGVLVEAKRFGVALHWRAAPEQAEKLGQLAAELAATKPDLVLLPAHRAVEIRVAGGGKGEALDAFMTMPPFAGRRPVFVGDDVTDEPAIEAARRMGGIGLHVHRDFGGSTERVRRWLAAAAMDAAHA